MWWEKEAPKLASSSPEEKQAPQVVLTDEPDLAGVPTRTLRRKASGSTLTLDPFSGATLWDAAGLLRRKATPVGGVWAAHGCTHSYRPDLPLACSIARLHAHCLPTG